ncbi:MAG: tetratricopeptide repeat protein [Acidobacteria bacterium]|nr:tetratricopeptide repeat protein [Acidobacteriota bacterium]
MLCQTCGALNHEEREYCFRCQNKLLVLSGIGAFDADFDAEYDDPEEVSFDEHLLERVSALEEVVRRSAETLKALLGEVRQQERSIFVNQTGLLSLKEILERRSVVPPEELIDIWESKMGEQMLALEKKERFVERRDRIVSLFRGTRSDRFGELINEVEQAIESFDQKRAMKLLEDAFKLDRQNHELSFFIGETYFNDNDLDRSRIFLERTLEVQPHHFDAAVLYGVLLREQNDLTGAEQWLRHSLQISQDSFLPYFSLGAIYALQGKYIRAQKFLEHAIELEPIPQAHYLLGTILYEKGQLEKAIKALQTALRIDPEYEEAIYSLGLCYLDRNWHRKAMRCFESALELNPNKMEYQHAVRLYQDHVEGRHDAHRSPESDSFGKAEQLANDRNYEDALEEYRRAAKADPDNPRVLLPYALLCSHLDENAEAIAVATRILAQKPSEMVAAAAYTTMVEALRSEGKYKEGNRLLEEMLSSASSNYARSIAYYEKAYNLAEMGENLDDALESAQLSLKFSPRELRQFPLAALGWVYFKRHEYDSAIDYLSKSNEIGATPTHLMHLGMALLEAGKKEQARAVFRRAKKFEGEGAGLEEKILDQMRTTTRLIDRMISRRPRARAVK